MAGTINLALTQQFDMDGAPLSGGLLWFYTAGTSTPQTPFQDVALTIAHPNPIVLDASGRVPMFYLADGFIKIRLNSKNGVVIIAADQLLVIGPSSGGGGGGGSVDPTTIIATGDIKARYGTGALDGFVRCNGLTIGQTGSSATELAGPKAQALYEYLWPLTNITLDSAVKGASATADFGALKRLILPDLRGRIIAGMDDMGATAAGRLTSAATGFGVSAIVLGNAGGLEGHILARTELPNINLLAVGHGATWTQGVTTYTNATYTFAGDPAGGTFNSTNNDWLRNTGSNNVAAGTGANDVKTGGNAGSVTGTTSIATGSVSLLAGIGVSMAGSIGGTLNLGGPGSGLAHQITQPTIVLTFYMKL